MVMVTSAARLGPAAGPGAGRGTARAAIAPWAVIAARAAGSVAGTTGTAGIVRAARFAGTVAGTGRFAPEQG